MDYSPALPPHLGADHHQALDLPSSASEEPSKVSDKPKNTLTLTESIMLNQGLPRINTLMNMINLGCHIPNLKKYVDKCKHKARSRYVSSSSEEDQSSVARHRSSKQSGAISAQD